MTVPVPATICVLQEIHGQKVSPQIRVWCHPYAKRPPERGDDYYVECNSFASALDFIDTHPEADDHPLIAFKGYEMDLFQVEAYKENKNERR